MKAHREISPVSGRRVVTDTDARYPDWASVYADNGLWVYRMIFNRVGNRSDAEDLGTEVRAETDTADGDGRRGSWVSACHRAHRSVDVLVRGDWQ